MYDVVRKRHADIAIPGCVTPDARLSQQDPLACGNRSHPTNGYTRHAHQSIMFSTISDPGVS